MSKLNTIVLAAFLLAIGHSKAQDELLPPVEPGETEDVVEMGLHVVELGFRLMPTVSDFELAAYDGGTIAGQATFGYGVGGLLAINFSEHFGIQTELIYNSLSQRYVSREMDRRLHVDYLNVPLMLSVSTGKSNYVNLNFVAGPQVGFTLGYNVDVDEGSDVDTLTAIYDIDQGDFGVAYGAGLSFSLNEMRSIRLDIGYRGVFGFTNISNAREPEDQNTYYDLGSTYIRTNALYAGLTLCF
jgi:hypothetical protein